MILRKKIQNVRNVQCANDDKLIDEIIILFNEYLNKITISHKRLINKLLDFKNCIIFNDVLFCLVVLLIITDKVKVFLRKFCINF